MPTYCLHHDSRIGRLLILSDGAAVCGVYLPGHARGPVARADWQPADPVCRMAARQLDEWLAGTRETFDLPLAPRGTPFQLRVWQELRAIPFGRTISYSQLAVRVGSSPRAVGSANARNPLSIVVPCHRVVGADGSLTGYAGGVELKQRLLDMEQRAAGNPATPKQSGEAAVRG